MDTFLFVVAVIFIFLLVFCLYLMFANLYAEHKRKKLPVHLWKAASGGVFCGATDARRVTENLSQVSCGDCTEEWATAVIEKKGWPSDSGA